MRAARCTARSPTPTSTSSTANAYSSSALLAAIVRDFPGLRIVLEHITTARGGGTSSRGAPANVAATITPQHLLYSRNALFAGGIRPHFYCLPVLKREAHRQALVAAATSGNPKFFLGTDSRAARAAHEGERLRLRRLLFGARGAASSTPRPSTPPVRSTAWRPLPATTAPTSTACRAHGDTVTLRRESWTVPAEYPFGEGTIVPLRAGETVQWRVA